MRSVRSRLSFMASDTPPPWATTEEREQHRVKQSAVSDTPAKLATRTAKRFRSVQYQRSRFGNRWNGYTGNVGS